MAYRASAACSLVASILAAASLAIHAQHPASGDLEGIWNYATMTPLERPRDLAAKATLTPAEAAEYERSTIEPQQRAAARAQARRARGPADGPEDRALNERCLNWSVEGPPLLPGVYNNNVQLIQTRGYVAIVSEMIHDARIVPMDGRAHVEIPRWMGDSRGRWEGSTLVVDTVGFTDKTAFRGSTEHLHLVERFTRIDADTIEYRFTADDPSTWARPFTAMFPLKKTGGPIYEYACHEGNARSMIGMLMGARAQEHSNDR
jgi:hypothetical protein